MEQGSCELDPMENVQQAPHIQMSAFRGLDSFLSTLDISLLDLLDDVGLAEIDLKDWDATVPLNDFSECLERASQLSGESALGLRYGDSYRLGDSGAFGYVVLNSPTARVAVQNIVRYMNIFVSVYAVRFEESDGTASLSWEFPVLFHPRTQFVDFCVLFILRRLRMAMGKAWQPLAVELERRTPKDLELYSKHLGPRISFNSSINRLSFRTADLASPMPEADASLFDVVKDFCDRLHDDFGDESEFKAVRYAIAQLLPNAELNLEAVANVAAMPAQEIQRLLDRSGTSFSKVVSNTREALATRYLRDSELPLTEIALLLGFSELSAFSRACNRWFGCAPSAYRKRFRGWAGERATDG